jgi:hypothetical protein
MNNNAIPTKILQKINKTDDCWLWKGHIDNGGYGVHTGNGLPDRYVHRSMFFWNNGYLPKSPKVVGHICEVRNCVKPDHLTEQTQRENVKQYTDKITHCPKGHEYSENNTGFRKSGARRCRACAREYTKNYYKLNLTKEK